MAKGRRFGFGIIGCGMIAGFHAKVIADIRGAYLAACFSSTPASADRFAAEHHCRSYHQLADMLADPAVDVVTICTPSGCALGTRISGRSGWQACDR